MKKLPFNFLHFKLTSVENEFTLENFIKAIKDKFNLDKILDIIDLESKSNSDTKEIPTQCVTRSYTHGNFSKTSEKITKKAIPTQAPKKYKRNISSTKRDFIPKKSKINNDLNNNSEMSMPIPIEVTLDKSIPTAKPNLEPMPKLDNKMSIDIPLKDLNYYKQFKLIYYTKYYKGKERYNNKKS